MDLEATVTVANVPDIYICIYQMRLLVPAFWCLSPFSHICLYRLANLVPVTKRPDPYIQVYTDCALRCLSPKGRICIYRSICLPVWGLSPIRPPIDLIKQLSKTDPN
jgi:hypothetical protein